MAQQQTLDIDLGTGHIQIIIVDKDHVTMTVTDSANNSTTLTNFTLDDLIRFEQQVQEMIDTVGRLFP